MNTLKEEIILNSVDIPSVRFVYIKKILLFFVDHSNGLANISNISQQRKNVSKILKKKNTIVSNNLSFISRICSKKVNLLIFPCFNLSYIMNTNKHFFLFLLKKY